jgi:hypothetical protein
MPGLLLSPDLPVQVDRPSAAGRDQYDTGVEAAAGAHIHTTPPRPVTFWISRCATSCGSRNVSVRTAHSAPGSASSTAPPKPGQAPYPRLPAGKDAPRLPLPFETTVATSLLAGKRPFRGYQVDIKPSGPSMNPGLPPRSAGVGHAWAGCGVPAVARRSVVMGTMLGRREVPLRDEAERRTVMPRRRPPWTHSPDSASTSLPRWERMNH